ncbi:GNAT family N-acetyltransferase [Hwanghaeella grinnelliae]|uniref:GNAT family N-acetyltransferase n=1 Tax=Hwanghaeella grinnelliae TaxID=2500179 RepID=A0A3S2WAN0_9PROT|nr:GNAT family N-acetyltransferase [Hwanghaeella grinnelliae]RVU38038.1 GNAT family N-acetyltransferase [Hwanghaeella grinnelliae]
MSVTVRDARPRDRDIIVSFLLALNVHEYALRSDRDTTLAGAAAHLRSLEEDIRHSRGFVLVGEIAKEPAGFLIGIEEIEPGQFVVKDQRAFGCITDIYVAESKRCQGLSRAMIDEACHRFKEMGLKRVLVTGLASNPSATGTYPALGFEPLYNTYEKRLDT